MKGLLIKDLKLIKNNMRNSVIMIILMAGGMGAYMNNTTFLIVYLALVGTMFVSSTISYDEFDNGFSFLLSLPVTRRGYVAEKYIFGLCMGCSGWLIGTIISVTAGAVRQTMMPADTLMAALVLLPVDLILLSVMIPAYLKFGIEKSRFVMIGVMALLAVLMIVGAKAAETMNIDLDALTEKLSMLGMGATFAAMTGIGLAMLLLSCRISIRIMERKEF